MVVGNEYQQRRKKHFEYYIFFKQFYRNNLEKVLVHGVCVLVHRVHVLVHGVYVLVHGA